MPSQNEFVDYLVDQLVALGNVRAKRMFGGHGVYRGELMFGLVASDTLYLKADDESRADFEAEGLERFVYEKGGMQMSMSYYEAPADALDDPEVMVKWARKGYAAAQRAAKSKPKKRRSKAKRK